MFPLVAQFGAPLFALKCCTPASFGSISPSTISQQKDQKLRDVLIYPKGAAIHKRRGHKSVTYIITNCSDGNQETSHQTSNGSADKGLQLFSSKWKKPDELNPVVLIPGIGGSVLNAVLEDGRVERVWIKIVNADNEFQENLWCKFHPDTGRVECLHPGVHVEPSDANYGLGAVDCLDPDLPIPVDAVLYYRTIINTMRKWGYDDGKTLFGFGYDFRQSNRVPITMDRLAKKLQQISETRGGRKVDVVTHSMGGLVLKCFLALHSDLYEKYVNKWIAICAPFQGAPGDVMDTLLTGVTFLTGWEEDLFIKKWTAHQLMIACPSMYELMGNDQFKWKTTPELQIFQSYEKGDGKSVDAGEFSKVYGVLKDALVGNSVTVCGKQVPLPLDLGIVSWTSDTWKFISAAALPAGTKFFNIYGTSKETPFSASYGTPLSPIKSLEELRSAKATFQYVDGDGTVPAESAVADGLEAVFRVSVPATHSGILKEPKLMQLLHDFLEVNGPLDPNYNPSEVIKAKELEFHPDL